MNYFTSEEIIKELDEALFQNLRAYSERNTDGMTEVEKARYYGMLEGLERIIIKLKIRFS